MSKSFKRPCKSDIYWKDMVMFSSNAKSWPEIDEWNLMKLIFFLQNK